MSALLTAVILMSAPSWADVGGDVVSAVVGAAHRRALDVGAVVISMSAMLSALLSAPLTAVLLMSAPSWALLSAMLSALLSALLTAVLLMSAPPWAL
jgi:hypothetical protein